MLPAPFILDPFGIAGSKIIAKSNLGFLQKKILPDQFAAKDLVRSGVLLLRIYWKIVNYKVHNNCQILYWILLSELCSLMTVIQDV